MDWLLETHAHADHLSAAPLLQAEVGGQLAIGHEIVRVQDVFGKIFNAGTQFQRDGSQAHFAFSAGQMRAGQLPPREDNGERYLKTPLNVLRDK